MSINKTDLTHTTLPQMNFWIKTLALHLLLLATGLGLIRAQGGLLVSFPQDTVFACTGMNIDLTPVVSGQSGNVVYAWSDGSNSPTLSIAAPNGLVLYWVLATNNGNFGLDSIWVMGMPECVWPGDANGDAIANNFDLLYLGRAYQTSGMVRPHAHLNWLAQGAPSWTHTFANGINYAHSDADGNGLIDTSDVHGILHNYLVPQSAGQGNTPGGVPLSVVVPAGPFNPGDSIVIPVYLGTAAQPANEVYGIAFSLNYLSTQVKVSEVKVRYPAGWFGTPGLDVITLDKNFDQQGVIDIAISRNDQLERSGYGRLADIIITVDDVAGKNSSIEVVELKLSHTQLTDYAGNPQSLSLKTEYFSVVMGLDETSEALLKVYPNPATETLYLEQTTNAAPVSLLEIYSMDGRLVMRNEMKTGNNLHLDVSDWTPGMYLIKGSREGILRFSQKVRIQ